MVLSLTDILAVQSIEKPYKASDNYKASSGDSVSFKDVLDKPEAESPVEYIKNFTSNPKDKLDDARAAGDAVISGGKLVVDAVENNVAPATDASPSNNEGVSNIAVNINDSVAVQNNSDSNAEATPIVTLPDLTDALSVKQQNGAALTNDQLKSASAILTKLSDTGIPKGMSADQVVYQVIAQVQSSGFDATAGIEDILQKMNLANVDNKQGLTVEQLAAQALSAVQVAGVDTSKIASKVIEVAKELASKPEVSASDLRSLQVAGLSNLGKKKDKNEDGQDSSVLDIPTDFIAPVVAQNNQDVRQNSAEHLQDVLNKSNGLLEQQKVANTLIQNGQDNTTAEQVASTNSPTINLGNTAQNNNGVVAANNAFSASVSQVIAQAEAGKDEFITTGAKDTINTSGSMSTENFIKFQTMLDDAQAAAKSTTNTRMGSPSEVMAQIKFGLAGKGGDENNISIQLHPKELGKVDITMQMNADGTTYVKVIAENTDTLNLLQKESEALRGMLTDALKTDSSNLNFSFQQGGSDDWGQGFSNNQYGNNRLGGASESLPGSEYLASQSYRYNMIATDGLDIRV